MRPDPRGDVTLVDVFEGQNGDPLRGRQKALVKEVRGREQLVTNSAAMVRYDEPDSMKVQPLQMIDHLVHHLEVI
mgnify:CR=1 FL=1